jgi:glycosyltransferase involved in cell wall biosynthesis
MRILNLGLDSSILNKNSALAKRAVEYGALVEKYIIITPAKENKIVQLSDQVVAHGVKSKNKILGLFKIYYLAKKLIIKNNIGVVSVQDQYYLALIGLKLARKFNKGLEIQVHGFEKYGGLRKLIAKYVLPRADSVRVVSQRLKNRLMGEFKVRGEKIMVVPIFVNIKSKVKSQKSKVENKDKFIFLTVGRLVSVKNIGMQIEAMAEVIKNLELRIKNYELWIVGDGEERKILEKLCYELRVASCVKFFGWQDNLDKFYRQADVFLLTSHSEGWPLVILEAANYGLPIIMTDVGSAGELIINNESGIVMPANDEIKLKEAMIDLIENNELRKKLGEGAMQAVSNLPRKEQILELYKKSWELALKNKV